MEEYIPRGKPSYPLTVNRERAIQLLLRVVDTPEFTKAINILKEKTPIYLVGGVVRDALLSLESKDVDLAVSIFPNEVRELLEKEGFRVISTGEEHGTLTVLIDNEGVEITTFRRPSARDSSEFGSSIEEDLSGRDFTINAIAFSPLEKQFIDPFNGIDDLINGVCRAVEDPSERLGEDALRILRLIRFGTAEGRTIDSATRDAVKEHLPKLKEISIERIQKELEEIFTRDFPGDALQTMYDFGVLEIILPELLPTVGCEQNEFHIHDVFEHTIWVLNRSKNDPLLRIACLLHDIAKPATLTVGDDGRRHFYNHEHVGAEMSQEILERLKFSKQSVRRISRLVKEHMRPLQCGPAGVRRVMRDLDEDFDLWLAMKRADAPPVVPEEEFRADYERFTKMVEDEEEKRKLPAYGKLAVDGNDLISLGLTPGPKLGKVLKELEEIVIENPEKNDKSLLLGIAKSSMNGGTPSKPPYHYGLLFFLVVLSAFGMHFFYFKNSDLFIGEFSQWVSEVEEKNVSGDFPKVSVRISLSSAAEDKEWIFDSAEEVIEEGSNIVLRILQLLRAGKLMNVSEEAKDGEGFLAISINSGDNSFQSKIPWSAVRENLQAKNLLVLLESQVSESKIEAT